MKMYPHLPDCRCGNYLKFKLSKTHPWWVNAPAYHNCFWVYLRHNTRTHTLNEIAILHDLSISAITSTEKAAVRKLQRRSNLIQFIDKNKM